MKTKRKKSTRRRKRVTHLSAGPRRRRHGVKTRARRRRSRRGLSEIFTPAGAMAAGKAILGASAGGFVAGIGHKMMGTQSAPVRIGAGVVLSALLYAVVGMPNVAAGFAGGVAALEGQGVTEKLMAEMGLSAGRYADAAGANTLPAVVNANGVPLSLMEDTDTGQMYYFDEQTGQTHLAEDIYPQYANRY